MPQLQRSYMTSTASQQVIILYIFNLHSQIEKCWSFLKEMIHQSRTALTVQPVCWCAHGRWIRSIPFCRIVFRQHCLDACTKKVSTPKMKYYCNFFIWVLICLDSHLQNHRNSQISRVSFLSTPYPRTRTLPGNDIFWYLLVQLLFSGIIKGSFKSQNTNSYGVQLCCTLS